MPARTDRCMCNSSLDTGIYRQGPFLEHGFCHACRSSCIVLWEIAGFSNTSSWGRASINHENDYVWSSHENDCSIAFLRHCVIALTAYILGTDAKDLGNGKCLPNEAAKLLSYWDKASVLIFWGAMQRET